MMPNDYLLYGIVSCASADPPSGPEPLLLPRGLGGGPVQLIAAGDLGAVASAIEAAPLAPSLADVLTYARVVEAIHAQRTIVPMRYGCSCAGEAAVVDLLRTRRAHYGDLLRRVEGCVEIAVCFALPPPAPLEHAPPPADAGEQSAATAYLAQRARIYAARDQRARDVAVLTDRICAACAGQFVRCKVDGRDAGQSAAAATFLVKRRTLDAFRAALLTLSRTQPLALRLSGPWPPYTFVVPEVPDERRPS